MYDTVLVPTDGSPTAGAAVTHALELAARFEATLHALTVLDPDEETAERGSETVDHVADRGAERGVPVETAVERGAPREVITDYADRVGADVVVMGTHGRTGLDRALLGSVTEQVVRTSPVPVLTVRRGANEHTVTDPEAALDAAREKLAVAGHDDPAFPEGPSRQRASWVVRAETADAAYNVHVDSATGEAHLVQVGGRSDAQSDST